MISNLKGFSWNLMGCEGDNGIHATILATGYKKHTVFFFFFLGTCIIIHWVVPYCTGIIGYPWISYFSAPYLSVDGDFQDSGVDGSCDAT